MSGEHRIILTWQNGPEPFAFETYPRTHQIAFKNGQSRLTASAAPAYKGDGKNPDPEELLVAALSSCHMLTFLALCAKKKVALESYEDDAIGYLENDGGKLWVARVILRPRVVGGADAATLAQIHHQAHLACFIANSVKTDVQIQPR